MKTRIDIIRELIKDCIITHNEEVLVNLIYNLEKEYKEIATLSTLGEYNENWTHEKLLNYITKEM
jgi:hypothetical protein